MKNELTQFMVTWKGDDLKNCLLQKVYASRGNFNLGDENMKKPASISCNHCWDYQENIKKENENLKRDKETISHNANHFNNEIIKLEHEIEKLKAANQCLWNVIKNGADTVCNNSDLAAENAQLKAQLQNRDKVSQVERCEHSGVEIRVKKPICECCKGIGRLGGYLVTLGGRHAERDIFCPRCCGTGLVGEA